MDQEILNYAKARYEEEQLRFEHIENKCSRFLSFLTLSIGAFSGLAGYNKKEIFQFCGPFDWAIFIVGSLAFLALFCSWGHALLSLKLVNAKVAPRNQETIDYFRSASTIASHEHIFNCYMDTTKRLVPIIDEKARNLKLSYEELAVGGGLIFILVTLIAIKGLSS
jgi:hypothetical protein